jgi:hypothetical protein
LFHKRKQNREPAVLVDTVESLIRIVSSAESIDPEWFKPVIREPLVDIVKIVRSERELPDIV